MSKASDKLLGELHGKLAASMIAALDAGETAEYLLDEYSEELPEEVTEFLTKCTQANPALLTAVTKFLKDNNISCSIEDNEEMSELQKRLDNKKRKRVGNVIPIEE